MYIVKPSKNWAGSKAGETYVLERANAGQLLVMQKPEMIEQVDGLNLRGKGTLIVRPGGIGDLVHMDAAVREVAKNTSGPVDICIAERYMEVMKHCPHIRKVVEYPLKLSDAMQYETIHWLEDSVESETELHMADAFLNACGFDHTTYHSEEKRPRIHLPPGCKMPKKGKKPRVGFQVKASAKCRTPTVKLLGKLMEMYHREGWEVWIFGAPGEVQLDDPAVENTTTWKKPLSILESANWMRTCDLFIAPDSGLLHVAASLKIPSVGLYGPFPADLRVRYSPYNVSVEAKAPCAPCFWHSRGAHFPPGCPGAKHNECIVLAGIRPETVIKAGELAMEKKKNK